MASRALGQGAEANGAADDRSPRMAREVHIASHKAFNLLSLNSKVQIYYICLLYFQGRTCREETLWRTAVKVFPWRLLMILGHKTKTSEVLALLHLKRSGSEK